MKPWQPTMTSATQPERFDGQSVTWRFFRVLGVTPALGRDFEESEDRWRGLRVMILSDALWRRRFGADPAILGSTVKLDENLYIVIGILPRGFENVLSPSAELWSPLQYDEGNIATLNSREWGHHLRMIGRARAGVRLEGIRRELDLIARVPVPEFPRPGWASLKTGFIADSLQDEITRGIKPALLAVLGAVILVLLIASVNVTNLLLARGAQRRGEFAMRAALGAGRVRMLRQLLTARLLTLQVHVSGRRFEEDAATLRFFAQALDSVRQTPGVTAAAFTSLLPLSGDPLGQYGIQFEGGEGRESVFRYVATPGFCETMGIALLRGRLLDARDVAGAPSAVVISESLARAKFPGKEPIGQRLRAGPPNRPWSSVVGVVGDIRQASLAESQPNAVYLAPEQSWFADNEMSLVVRGHGNVAALAPAIKNAIWSVDKDQPIVRVAMMDQLLAATAAERRFAMIVFEAFALVALGPAALGRPRGGQRRGALLRRRADALRGRARGGAKKPPR